MASCSLRLITAEGAFDHGVRGNINANFHATPSWDPRITKTSWRAIQ
jgi:hypothetical protein